MLTACTRWLSSAAGRGARAWLALAIIALCYGAHARRLADLHQGGDVTVLADAWLMFVLFVFNIPLFAAAVTLARREIGWTTVALCALASFLATEASLVHVVIHDFLDDHRVYPDILRHDSPANRINSQYAALSGYLVVLTSLAGLLAVRRMRSLSRLFLLAISLGHLGVIGVSHVTLTQWSMLDTLEAARAERMRAMRTIAALPSDADFQEACRGFGVACWVVPADAPFRSGSPLLGDAVRDLRAGLSERTPTAGRSLELLPLGPLNLHVTAKQAAVAVRDGRHRVVEDTVSLTEAAAWYKIYYAVTNVAAHAVWMFGGFALLCWHRRRRQRRPGA